MDALLAATGGALPKAASSHHSVQEEAEFLPLKAWLVEHRLEKNYEALRESEMSLEALLDMEADELVEFLVEIKVPAGARKRITLAVKHAVEENKGAKELDEWLTEHNLTKFAKEIKASDMSLDNLLEMETGDFKDYAQELGLNVLENQVDVRAAPGAFQGHW